MLLVRIVLLAFTGAAVAAQPPPRAGTAATVSGRVVDAITGRPVAGAIVTPAGSAAVTPAGARKLRFL